MDSRPSEGEIAARIVQAVNEGSPESEAELYNRYHRGLLTFLRYRTKDSQLAEDLAQDVFLLAIAKLREAPIDSPEKLSPWLLGIAKRMLSGANRKAKRRDTHAREDLGETVADSRPEPAASLSREQVATIVRMLLDELSEPRDREILKRTYLYDQDKSEVCQALDMKDEKGKLHFNRVLYRAKKRFRDLVTRAELRQQLRIVR